MQKPDFRKIYRRFKERISLDGHLDTEAAALNITSNIRFSGPNVFILFFAIIIASVGLNVNSTAVIIGAMLISPLMSPIVGMGLAIGTNDLSLLKNSLKNWAIMVVISVVAATIYFCFTPLSLVDKSELYARTNPTFYDVLIAFFGGCAGILETSRKERGTVMSGVAIATALMPPLCTVGYGLAELNPAIFLGAFYLFFINTTFIALAAFIGTKLLHFKEVIDENPIRQKRARITAIVGLIVIITPSFITAIKTIQENIFEAGAEAFVQEWKETNPNLYILEHNVHPERDSARLEITMICNELTPEETELFMTKAADHHILPHEIDLRLNSAYARLSEKETFNAIMAEKKQEMERFEADKKQLQKTIDQLQKQLDQLCLPADQITAQLKALFPDIDTVKMAVTSTPNDREVVAIITTKGTRLTDEQITRVTDWLKVTTSTKKVLVINQ